VDRHPLRPIRRSTARPRAVSIGRDPRASPVGRGATHHLPEPRSCRSTSASSGPGAFVGAPATRPSPVDGPTVPAVF